MLAGPGRDACRRRNTPRLKLAHCPVARTCTTHRVHLVARLRMGAQGRAMTDDERDECLDRIERMLTLLVEQQTVKDFYEIDDFAKLASRAPFTVREWARLGRIRARSAVRPRRSAAWVVSHQELQRYQREGLLPEKRA